MFLKQGATIRPIVPRHEHSYYCLYCSPLNFLPRASSKIMLNYFELFFCKKKYLLLGASGMLWAGESVSGSVDQWISGSVDQWISGSVRDVCLSHQSD